MPSPGAHHSPTGGDLMSSHKFFFLSNQSSLLPSSLPSSSPPSLPRTRNATSRPLTLLPRRSPRTC